MLASWRGLPIGDIAVRVLTHLVGDEFDRDAFEALVRDAFDFPAPTVPLDDGLAVLELFHGPTLAFKDFGARFLARVFGHVLRRAATTPRSSWPPRATPAAPSRSGFHGVPRVQGRGALPGGQGLAASRKRRWPRSAAT